jgi:hypothetical protein
MRWIPREKAGELPIRVPRSDSPDSRNSGARDVSCIEWHVPDGKDSYLKTMARRLHRSRHRMHRLFTQVPTQCRDVPWRGSMGSYHFAIEFRGAVGRSMGQDFATTMSCHRLENSSFIESSHSIQLGEQLPTECRPRPQDGGAQLGGTQHLSRCPCTTSRSDPSAKAPQRGKAASLLVHGSQGFRGSSS